MYNGSAVESATSNLLLPQFCLLAGTRLRKSSALQENAMSVHVVGNVLKSVLTSLASIGRLGLMSPLSIRAEAQAARQVRKMWKNNLRITVALCDGERLRYKNTLLNLRTVKHPLARSN